MKRRTIVLATLLAFAGVAFIVLAPVVPETQELPCTGPCGQALSQAHLTSNPFILSYSGSVSYHLFGIGAVYGACGPAYEVGDYRFESPTFCGA